MVGAVGGLGRWCRLLVVRAGVSWRFRWKDASRTCCAGCKKVRFIVVNRLQEFLDRLPNSYTQTRSRTTEVIGQLEGWVSECRPVDSVDAWKSCIIRKPNKGQMMSIQAAWYGDKRSG